MRSWSPSCFNEKPSYIHYIIGQGKAKLRLLKLTPAFHHLPSIAPKQLYALVQLGCMGKVDTSKYKLIFICTETVWKGALSSVPVMDVRQNPY